MPPSRSRRAPVSTDKRFRKIAGGGGHGPAERWQHSGRALELTDRAGIVAARATEEHLIDILALRNIVTPAQTDAAMRFKSDYHAAAIASRTVASYSGMANARDFFRAERERSDGEEAAYRRWRNALAALPLRAGAVTVAVICHDMQPAPRDIPALQEGLSQLARFYGM